MANFQPISGGLSSALLGVADPIKFVDTERIETKDSLYARRRVEKTSNDRSSLRYTILLIIITAIIFITIVAIYDVIRNGITNYYARLALENKCSFNTSENISRTLIANEKSFQSSVVFACLAIVLAVILVILIIQFI